MQSNRTCITTCKYMQVNALGTKIQYVNVIHCIKDNINDTNWIQTYTINIEVPIYLTPMILFNVAPPCSDIMVALPPPKTFFLRKSTNSRTLRTSSQNYQLFIAKVDSKFSTSPQSSLNSL